MNAKLEILDIDSESLSMQAVTIKGCKIQKRAKPILLINVYLRTHTRGNKVNLMAFCEALGDSICKFGLHEILITRDFKILELDDPTDIKLRCVSEKNRVTPLHRVKESHGEELVTDTTKASGSTNPKQE
ncbi:hypothetical protein NDU88_005642 [Pleurodeles waltl]|uniref:Uncharacterized protein n=1 Tax=Pleurodeles waltl TaxID=8319 RepID=A0AAV7MYJ7_PLEWA|nr:hypothetical protein NDU88_005642 [Pleurodeles waltl]